METPIYYGQIKCQAKYKSSGKPCRNNAYYSCDGNYMCGVHSSKDSRVELPKNVNAKKEAFNKEYSLHLNTVDQAMKENQSGNKSGKVICTKMLMMRNPQLIHGFLNVFPNYKHNNRKDGLGCASLSPKSMGPVEHNQPNLPPAKNLENFWQGGKVFPEEVDADGRINPKFYEEQRRMYADTVPHRHKELAKGKNKPLFWLWRTQNGVNKRLSYIEARQFYCNYYERFALKDENFLKIKKISDSGVNLNIYGYDAYQPDKNIEDHYLDASRPFGHELVLYTLLTCQNGEYPWRKHKTEDF